MCHRASGALGALTDLARNHCGPYGSLGAVVGGLDCGILEIADQVSPTMVPSQLFEQAPIVRVGKLACADDGSPAP